MLLTILAAALAACGAFLILWAILDALLLPLPQRDTFHVIYLHGSVQQVEQTLRAGIWLRERRGARGTLLFVRDALSAEAAEAAGRYLEDFEGTALCRAAELPEMLRWEKETVGAGSD